MVDTPNIASPDYMDLIKRLTTEFDTGPVVLRIGGVTSDHMRDVWSQQVLEAAKTVAKSTGELAWGHWVTIHHWLRGC